MPIEGETIVNKGDKRMIIHKQYECEHCGQEFDEEDACLKHESACAWNVEHKKCGSCDWGCRDSHYGQVTIKCVRWVFPENSCNEWRPPSRKKVR